VDVCVSVKERKRERGWNIVCVFQWDSMYEEVEWVQMYVSAWEREIEEEGGGRMCVCVREREIDTLCEKR
jgi:hypothetical protein